MKYNMRALVDKLFTALTALSVVVLLIVLIIVLGPMMSRGSTAVFFKSTVQFRKMQYDTHERGDRDVLFGQLEKTNVHRDYIYKELDEFKKGIDTDALAQEAKKIYRDFGDQLKYNNVSGDELSSRRKVARKVRSGLEKAFRSEDKSEVISILDEIEGYRSHKDLAGTEADNFFILADEYRKIAADFDFSKRREYLDEIRELEDLLVKLLGPRPDEPMPVIVMDRYGATRMDLAEKLYDRILWKDKWVQKNPDEPMVLTKVSRAELFDGTSIRVLFSYIQENFQEITQPNFTVYWQYFIDDSTSGHYFGGVGPEILGTLILTVLSMIFVFPLGVISAAYLVECASDNFILKVIRMSINTLAGVPSIVFGLFGLAFFVLYVPGVANMLLARTSLDIEIPSSPSILAASLTLAVLTLPVMIRASEEAIRSVPNSYKEASLGLGASRFRTFVQVTLPAAMPGILTGVILSLSRVAGETAPILFTGAVAFGSIPKSILSQTRTLSYGSYDIAVGDRIGMMVPHKQYGMVCTLVLLIICLNAIAIYFRAKMFRRLKGQ